MQFIIATDKNGGLCLQVFNRGHLIAQHNGQRGYLRRRIRKYIERMDRPSHAAHGMAAHVIWA